MNNLIDEVKKYITLLPELEVELIAVFQDIKLNKKESLIREGQNNVPLAFIQSGILRCFNLKDGKDVTNDFFFPNTFVTDYGSFITGVQAKQNFEAIENASMLTISRDKLFKLTERYPDLRLWGAKMAENLFTQSVHSHASHRADSPEERYNKLLTDRPEVIQHVPLHYIASYLGITQVHLSRIRNKKN